MGGASNSKDGKGMQGKFLPMSESNMIIDKGAIIKLPKGGLVVETSLGPIQFGMPPDSIKDSLGKPHGVSTMYILPTVKFDIKAGASLAEFEFPTYFNYFVLKRKITLITDKEGAVNLRTIFQETLLGPVDLHEVTSSLQKDNG